MVWEDKVILHWSQTEEAVFVDTFWLLLNTICYKINDSFNSVEVGLHNLYSPRCRLPVMHCLKGKTEFFNYNLFKNKPFKMSVTCIKCVWTKKSMIEI